VRPDRCEKVKLGGLLSSNIRKAHRVKPSSMSAVTITVLRWNACLSKIRLYAGITGESEATMVRYVHRWMKQNNSKKALGAVNQQERLKLENWICGFVDGEGCFSVSAIRNKTTKSGIQIFPEFVVTQGAKSLLALEEIKNFFKCGNIFVNKRYDNHNEHLYRYCVRSVKELKEKIIPFFEENNLKTYKQKDFLLFKKIVNEMVKKYHLTQEGRKKILGIAGKMNRNKKRV